MAFRSRSYQVGGGGLATAVLAMRGRGGAWVSNAAKADNQMRIDRRAAEYAHQMGLTVYLDDVMAALTGATEFCRALEADLGLQEGAMAVFKRTAGSTVRWAVKFFSRVHAMPPSRN